jgi:hypothetical protein
MSERRETRINACFGRVDLMEEKHFRFPRQSGLPTDYFQPSDVGMLRAIAVAAVIGLAFWGALAMWYAAVL